MAPKITQAQINQLLNCQDMLKASLQGLAKATKNLNQATIKVEKENAGLVPTSRGSPYYKKIQNSQAAKDAANAIDKIVQKYKADVERIENNIKMFESQIVYQKRMEDLINYYKNNIKTDKKKIQDLRSNKAIANRMATFYQDRDNTALWYRKYLRGGYWTVIIILCIVILYHLTAGGYVTAGYHRSVAAFHRTRARFGKGKPATSAQVGGNSPAQSTNRGESIIKSSYILSLLLILPYLIVPVVKALKSVFFPYA